ELVAPGLVRQSAGEYRVVERTPAGREAMRGTPPPLNLPAEARTIKNGTTGDVPVETLDRLKRWRSETARAAGIPAYIVFHDSTLSAIAAANPKDLAGLLRVPGIGD